MNEKNELKAIYRAILSAARQKGLARYSDLMALQDPPPGQKPNVALKTRLHDLLKICRRRGWPAISAIVVGERDALLSEKGLSSFVEGAGNAGYAVQDPREFEAEQKEALYHWASSAPDSLDLSDHELRELSQAIRGAGGGNAVRMHVERNKMKTGLRPAGWTPLWLKGLWKTILIPVIPMVMAGLIVAYWQNILNFLKQL